MTNARNVKVLELDVMEVCVFTELVAHVLNAHQAIESMAYSTISEKYGLCVDCNDGVEKPIIADRCKAYHYKNYRAKKTLEKQKEKSKFRSLINTKPNKELLIQNGKVPDTGLILWFKVKMDLNEPRCAECNAYKPSLKQWPQGWKSCQAHLLPKKNFKSISTHPLNCLVLGSGFSGLCHHHDMYDSSWETASKMKIWPEVVRSFKILYPLITTSEHKFIPKQLLDTL